MNDEFRFGSPMTNSALLSQALRAGPAPVGGGMVQRAAVPTSRVTPSSGGGITQDTTDAISAALKRRAQKQEDQKRANLAAGMTESGGYLGDVNVPVDTMVG